MGRSGSVMKTSSSKPKVMGSEFSPRVSNFGLLFAICALMLVPPHFSPTVIVYTIETGFVNGGESV